MKFADKKKSKVYFNLMEIITYFYKEFQII